MNEALATTAWEEEDILATITVPELEGSQTLVMQGFLGGWIPFYFLGQP